MSSKIEQALKDFYMLGEAARELGVNRVTIRRWIKAGKIKAQKVGPVVWIEKEAVEALK